LKQHREEGYSRGNLIQVKKRKTQKMPSEEEENDLRRELCKSEVYIIGGD